MQHMPMDFPFAHLRPAHHLQLRMLLRGTMLFACLGSVMLHLSAQQLSESVEVQENRPVGTWTDYLPYHQTEELVHCTS